MNQRLISILRTPLLCAVLLAWAMPAAVAAGRTEAPPEALRQVGMTQKLNEQIPLDLHFKDQDGRDVALGTYFDNGRPVILILGYFECPMLCTLVLNGLVESLKKINWAPGNEFEIVFVSIDPGETVPLARLKMQSYIKEYGKPETVNGWHFLVGNHENIRQLADAVGFHYSYDKTKGQYAHPATLMFLTPQGRVSRYLPGVKFEPKDVKLALYEAANGQIGSPVEQIFLSCFHYDAAQGAYAPAAMRIMQLGGIFTVIILGIALGGFWMRERTRKPKS